MKVHELRAFIMKEMQDGVKQLQEAMKIKDTSQITYWEKHIHDREIFIALIDTLEE